MSAPHFIVHTKRMEEAGLRSLWISLGADKQGRRLMHVSPMCENNNAEAAAKFPTRTFLIDGTDPVLEDVRNELIFADEPATPERVEAAILKHPALEQDLREFFADWFANGGPLTEEDLADAPEPPPAHVEGLLHYTRGLMRGMESKRGADASRT